MNALIGALLVLADVVKVLVILETELRLKLLICLWYGGISSFKDEWSNWKSPYKKNVKIFILFYQILIIYY